MNFVCRVHRQHTSVVMTIPKLVCEKTGLHAGDYVVLSDHTQAGGIPIFYFEKWRQEDGGCKRDSS